MKKSNLLLLPLALLSVASLAACNGGSGETSESSNKSSSSSSSVVSSSSSSSSSSSVHTHTYDKEHWVYDATKHWHADTCGHNTKIDEEEHSFVFGECKVCSYLKANEGIGYGYSDDGPSYIVNRILDKSKIAGEVVIPGTYDGLPVRTIEKTIFYGCSEITSLILCENIEFIEEYAFMDCSGINMIKLPLSLKEIDAKAFDGCTALSNGIVYFAGSYEDWEAVKVSEGNDALVNSVYTYNEDAIDDGNKYWHYVDGEPEIWKWDNN